MAKNGLANLRRFRRDASGVTAVEFALVGPVFFLLIFAIFETGFAFLTSLMIDHAVFDATRDIRTGTARQNEIEASAFADEICERAMIVSCDKLLVDVRSFADFGAMPDAFSSYDEDDACFDLGGGTRAVLVRAQYEWSWTAGFLQRIAGDDATLQASRLILTEPYGSGGDDGCD